MTLLSVGTSTKRLFYQLFSFWVLLMVWQVLPLKALDPELSIDFAKMQQQMQQSFPNRTHVASRWQLHLQQLRQLPEPQRLLAVNRFVHSVLDYGEDSQVWQRSDYWATPLEALGKGRADCEDYAILQYISLLYSGIPEQKLRLIYVRARLGGSALSRAHMVLGYYAKPSAMPMILDSLLEDVLPANERIDLTPVFSFNSAGLWSKSGAAAGSASARLSPWRDLLARLQKQGVEFHVVD